MSASDLATDAGVAALVAERVKERRLELGRKLSEVAADAGVSTGYLSAIENGSSVPSLPVLARLSRALELSLAEMLRTSASSRLARGRLTEALGSRRLAAAGSHMQIVRLAGKPGKRGRSPVELGHGDVFVYLHAGRLAIDVDDLSFELAAGDALHCDRPRSVRWRVLGDERAISLWTAPSADRLRRVAR